MRPAAARRAAVGMTAAMTGALVLTASPAAAQSLAERVRAAPDGPVHFAFDARPGVCGSGRSAITVDGGRISARGRGDRCGCACREGPVHVELRVDGGRVGGVDAWVGPAGEGVSGGATDLGSVPPAMAAAFLLDLAAEAPAAVGREAVFPATLARGVETWPRLLELARDAAVPRKTREAAVFWVGQEAAAEATEGLASVIEDPGDLEVREHAIFALSQREGDEAVSALIRVARTSREPELRKKALFWLGQRSEDPRVLDLFESILLGGR